MLSLIAIGLVVAIGIVAAAYVSIILASLLYYALVVAVALLDSWLDNPPAAATQVATQATTPEKELAEAAR